MNRGAREHILGQVEDVLERLRDLSRDPHLIIGRGWSSREKLALLRAIEQAEVFETTIKADLAK